jgi:uncharacterized protein YndB with AHSA1/START domain
MTGALHIDRSVAANSTELWEACATPHGLEGWYADRVTGAVIKGQSLRISWPGLGATVPLEVVDLDPGRRIVFRNGAGTVILEVSEGRVALTHAGLSDKDDHEGFEASWRVSLALLAHSLERQRGRKRRAAWSLARARTSVELAYAYFTTAEGLSAWLARGPGLGRQGEQYSMRSLSGESMTGRILVSEGGRDVALSWEEQEDSVLVLRSFPSPASQAERVLAICWSRWESRQGTANVDPIAAEIERELKRSVERLARALGQGGVA